MNEKKEMGCKNVDGYISINHSSCFARMCELVVINPESSSAS
jgi:hypothetical protein